jgi:hypothetical protein
MCASIKGKYEKLRGIIKRAEKQGVESSLHGEHPYMSLILTWRGISTLYHLQELMITKGIAKEVFKMILEYVF